MIESDDAKQFVSKIFANFLVKRLKDIVDLLEEEQFLPKVLLVLSEIIAKNLFPRKALEIGWMKTIQKQNKKNRKNHSSNKGTPIQASLKKEGSLCLSKSIGQKTEKKPK